MLSADTEPNVVDRFGMMSEAAKKISALTSVSTRLKQWQSNLKEKMDAKFAALEAESAKQDSGLDPETLKRIRQEVFGVFHKDSREIWKALFPVISAGWKLRVVSTPNGKGNKFYELVTDEKNKE